MPPSPSPAPSPFSRPVSIHLVDAFTSAQFKGNPAGVCVLDSSHTSWSSVPEDWLQHVALELNQVVAFVVRCQPDASTPDGVQRCLLRWFTPTTELDICGHGTLAASHCLFSFALVSQQQEIHFETRCGLLIARCADCTDSAAPLIELGLPC